VHYSVKCELSGYWVICISIFGVKSLGVWKQS